MKFFDLTLRIIISNLMSLQAGFFCFFIISASSLSCKDLSAMNTYITTDFLNDLSAESQLFDFSSLRHQNLELYILFITVSFTACSSVAQFWPFRIAHCSLITRVSKLLKLPFPSKLLITHSIFFYLNY